MIKLLFTILLYASVYTSLYAQNDPAMVKVSGGTFIMGDQKNIGEPDERPVHKVTLKGFSIGKTEVTVLQWKAYCKETQHPMPDAPAWGWQDANPIVSVSWEEAVAYCKWLSEKTKKTFRLPTEAEWEYAARGGKLSKGYTYSGSNDMHEAGWFTDNSNGSTHPVAQKRANELGLYDMSGNVWEWCNDYLDEYKADEVSNPTGAVRGTFVIRRGGSWNDGAPRGRPTYRMGNSFRRSYHSLGFRVAASLL